MTIYTDATNRYYIGDVLYGNHDIIYPTVSYTKADAMTGGTLQSDIESICTSLGYGFRRTGDFLTFFEFGFPSEPTRARFRLGFDGYYSTIFFRGRGDSALFSNTNYQDSGIFGKNEATNESFLVSGLYPETSLIYQRQVCGCFSDTSFSLLFIRRIPGLLNSPSYVFMHASFLEDGIYPNFTTTLGKCAIFVSRGDTTHYAKGWHYDIANSTNKEILSSGNAFYNIQCADLQTPGAQHTTGFYALYNDSLLYPMIGRYPDLLYAQGTYLIGKPVKLDGSVFPDLGHNHWLPVARWGTFTILMKCYSSLV